MAIIATNCEAYPGEERKKLHDDFFGHSKIKENGLREYFQQGVYYMGSLRDWTFTEKNTQSLQQEYKNVSEMRQTFLEKCIQCKSYFNIHRDKGLCVLS